MGMQRICRKWEKLKFCQYSHRNLLFLVFVVIYQLLKPIRSDFDELAAFGFPLLRETQGQTPFHRRPKHEAQNIH